MKQNNVNITEDQKGQLAKRRVRARFDEFKTWTLKEIKERFGTIPRKYIDAVEIESVLHFLEFTQVNNRITLDAGCGSGRFLAPLSKDMNVVGVDFSKGLLEKGRHQAPNAKLCVADLEHLPFKSQTFDTVLCVRVLQHITNQKNAINELSRVMKKGGILIILSYNNLTLHALYKRTRQLLENWKWYPDDYCSSWELKKMLSKAEVSVVETRGTVMANPWFFDYFNLTQFLQRVIPKTFTYYFEIFQKIERKLGGKFPFRHLSDRMTVKGVRR